MDLTPEHLKYLVCPVCRGSLIRAEATVDCTACARRYPVQDGLPVLIASRATAQ